MARLARGEMVAAASSGGDGLVSPHPVDDIAELGPRLLDPGLEQDPACVVLRVEHGDGGYRWLLDQWAEIRGLLGSGES
jgi:hypothetical protein